MGCVQESGNYAGSHTATWLVCCTPGTGRYLEWCACLLLLYCTVERFSGTLKEFDNWSGLSCDDGEYSKGGRGEESWVGGRNPESYLLNV